MESLHEPFLWLYVPAAALALGTAIYGLMRADTPATRVFTATMFVILGWIVTDFLEHAVPDLATKMVWRNLSYLFVGTLPMLWFVLVLHLVGRESLLRPLVWAALWAVPVAFNLGVWTNPWHHWVGGDPVLVTTPFSVAVVTSRGPLYVLFYAEACLFNLCSLVLLAWACRRREPLFVRQFVGFLIGESAVLVPNFLYMLGIPPFVHLDVTSLALGVASFSIAWGVFRFRGFDVTPVTRSLLVDRLEMPLVVVDARQRLVDFNPSAAAEFQMGVRALGSPLGTHDAIPEALRSYLRAGKGEAVRLETGGRWFDARGNWIETGRRDEKVFGALLLDVTQRHQAEVRLAAQQQALLVMTERERLARDLHDSLGQQLGFLNLKAQTLGQTALTSPEGDLAQGLAKMALVAREANEELRSYLTEAVPTSGTQDLASALAAVADRFQRVWGFLVEVRGEVPIPAGFLSPSQVGIVVKIVVEALHNARKHSGVSAATVTLWHRGRRFRAVVEDRGGGFDPAPSAAASSFGLAIMGDRALQAGGKLSVDSAPGRGTRVRFDLDLAAPAQEPAPAEAEGLRILVADDNPLYAEGLSGLLSSGGYQVVAQARDGDRALSLALQVKPDVVLLDIQMPGRSGLDVARELSQQLPQTKVVLLTVSASENDLYEALRWGASAYLLKTKVTSEELFETLDGLERGEAAFTPQIAARILEDHPPSESEALDQLSSRQREVLELVVEGLTYKEVGARLFISEPTIKYHMGEILRRLQLGSRAEAERLVRKAQREGAAFPPKRVT